MIIKEIEAKNVITKSNLPVCDFSVNPYTGCSHACKYCYASFMKRFSNHPEPWGEFIDVKIWDKIKNPKKYAGKELFIGSVTDPYNPQEELYGRTRVLLNELQGSGAKLSIATKSDLILRDLDLIKTFPDARVSWSVNTLDEAFKDDMDKAVSIERRLAAMKEFHKAGVRTTCFISPIFPGITDVKAIIEQAKNQCNLIWLENLNLRGNYKAVIMDYIKEKYPALLPLYQEIYHRGSRSYWEVLDTELKEYAAEIGLDYVTNDDSISRPFNAPPVIVNYFYHSKIKKSARKGAMRSVDACSATTGAERRSDNNA
ncbi:MAG: radical SAM mobile pair protein B [Lachnospiraceae bacterium]|nr:radical SAM mobile pair protein B [Lachnospiraceae bacterium]